MQNQTKQNEKSVLLFEHAVCRDIIFRIGMPIMYYVFDFRCVSVEQNAVDRF